MAFSLSMHNAGKKVLLIIALIIGSLGGGDAANKKILLIAGKPSHGPGDHEFRAGSLLLKKCLNVPSTCVRKATQNKHAYPHHQPTKKY